VRAAARNMGEFVQGGRRQQESQMDKRWGNYRYRTTLVEDADEGWTALEMSRLADGRTVRVARVTYWDAEGQFVFEMHIKEIPVIVLEELLAEAKTTIETR
jgi:hypothetical protein